MQAPTCTATHPAHRTPSPPPNPVHPPWQYTIDLRAVQNLCESPRYRQDMPYSWRLSRRVKWQHVMRDVRQQLWGTCDACQQEWSLQQGQQVGQQERHLQGRWQGQEGQQAQGGQREWLMRQEHHAQQGQQGHRTAGVVSLAGQQAQHGQQGHRTAGVVYVARQQGQHDHAMQWLWQRCRLQAPKPARHDASPFQYTVSSHRTHPHSNSQVQHLVLSGHVTASHQSLHRSVLSKGGLSQRGGLAKWYSHPRAVLVRLRRVGWSKGDCSYAHQHEIARDVTAAQPGQPHHIHRRAYSPVAESQPQIQHAQQQTPSLASPLASLQHLLTGLASLLLSTPPWRHTIGPTLPTLPPASQLLAHPSPDSGDARECWHPVPVTPWVAETIALAVDRHFFGGSFHPAVAAAWGDSDGCMLQEAELMPWEKLDNGSSSSSSKGGSTDRGTSGSSNGGSSGRSSLSSKASSSSGGVAASVTSGLRYRLLRYAVADTFSEDEYLYCRPHPGSTTGVLGCGSVGGVGPGTACCTCMASSCCTSCTRGSLSDACSAGLNSAAAAVDDAAYSTARACAHYNYTSHAIVLNRSVYEDEPPCVVQAGVGVAAAGTAAAGPSGKASGRARRHKGGAEGAAEKAGRAGRQKGSGRVQAAGRGKVAGVAETAAQGTGATARTPGAGHPQEAVRVTGRPGRGRGAVLAPAAPQRCPGCPGWPSLVHPVRADGVVCTSRLEWLSHTIGHEMLHAALCTLCGRGALGLPGVAEHSGHGPAFQALNRYFYGHTSYVFVKGLGIQAQVRFLGR